MKGALQGVCSDQVLYSRNSSNARIFPESVGLKYTIHYQS